LLFVLTPLPLCLALSLSLSLSAPDDNEDSATFAAATPTMMKIATESSNLLDLQRQRTLSSMHNAKVRPLTQWLSEWRCDLSSTSLFIELFALSFYDLYCFMILNESIFSSE
jgi:hypothetical protein